MRLRGILSKGRVLAALMAASAAVSLLGPAAGGPLRKIARLLIAPPGEVGMYAATAVAHHIEAAMRDTIGQEDARRNREGESRQRERVWSYADGHETACDEVPCRYEARTDDPANAHCGRS